MPKCLAAILSLMIAGPIAAAEDNGLVANTVDAEESQAQDEPNPSSANLRIFLNAETNYGGPNCWAASLYALGLREQRMYSSPQEYTNFIGFCEPVKLKSNQKIDLTELKPRTVLRFSNETKSAFENHSAIYLGNDSFWDKPHPGQKAGYRFAKADKYKLFLHNNSDGINNQTVRAYRCDKREVLHKLGKKLKPYSEVLKPLDHILANLERMVFDSNAKSETILPEVKEQLKIIQKWMDSNPWQKDAFLTKWLTGKMLSILGQIRQPTYDNYGPTYSSSGIQLPSF